MAESPPWFLRKSMISASVLATNAMAAAAVSAAYSRSSKPVSLM